MATATATATATAPAPARVGQRWLVSPTWDSFWLLGGIWMWLPAVFLQDVLQIKPLMISLVAWWLTWGGHNMAPLVTAWEQKDFRKSMFQNKLKFIYIPALLMVSGIAGGVLAGPALNNVPFLLGAVVFVYLAWSQWHFMGQHIGLLSIYRRTAGLTAPRERTLDRNFCYANTVLFIVASCSRAVSVGIFFNSPTPFGDYSGLVNTLLAVASSILLVAVLYREFKRETLIIPRILYSITMVAQPLGAALVPRSHLLAFFVAVFLIPHFWGAIGLGARMQANMQVKHRGGSPSRAFLVRSLLTIVIWSGLLYPVFIMLPGIVGGISDAVLNGSALPSATASVTLIAGILFGMRFGFAWLHFYYDRYVYAFSDPNVRKWMAPLLFESAGSR